MLFRSIGKALDHEIEGSHVQIGVDICKKYRENPAVIHAIEAHHGDVEPKSVLAFIIMAADAISAARPGARRENMESYIKRLETLESLCNGFEGVESAYAVQAGREEPRVTLRIRAERMWTVVAVEDNGPGIPPEKRGRIFEPFFTSKNTNYNWGMGLYYVRKIVQSHLGKLRLESREGQGASFLIMLPVYDPRRKE